MGEFDEFITGLMEMEVGGKQLKLDVRIKDKRKIKAVQGIGQINEEALEKLDNTFLEILKRSYPDEKPDALEAFYSKHDIEFMKTFYVAVGWATEESFEAKKKD